DRAALQTRRLQTVVAADRHVRSLRVRIPAAFDLSDAPPVDRRGIAVLFVAGDHAALAADALAHVDVKAVLLAGSRRAIGHARWSRRVAGRNVGGTRRQHEGDAVLGRAGEQGKGHDSVLCSSKTGTTRRIVEVANRAAIAALTSCSSRSSADEVVAQNLCGTNLSQIGSIRAAQTLNSGILLVGSSAGFVRTFTECSPPQWKGTNSVSSRIESVILTLNTAVPRRVRSVARSPAQR